MTRTAFDASSPSVGRRPPGRRHGAAMAVLAVLTVGLSGCGDPDGGGGGGGYVGAPMTATTVAR